MRIRISELNLEPFAAPHDSLRVRPGGGPGPKTRFRSALSPTRKETADGLNTDCFHLVACRYPLNEMSFSARSSAALR